jgi:hypothetical protein
MKEGEAPTLYMASYLLDVMCMRNVFATMNLSWHVAEIPVHVYFNVLWENRYKKYCTLIYDEFIACIYFIIFKKEFPRLSMATNKMIAKVGHWYLDEHSTYIRVFGATKAPHLLPAHVPDRLVMGEICYQTILRGYNTTFVKDKKQAFIPYGFHVGFYLVKDTAQAKQEGMIQLEFRFPTGRFRNNYPKAWSCNMLHRCHPAGRMLMISLRMKDSHRIPRTGTRWCRGWPTQT